MLCDGDTSRSLLETHSNRSRRNRFCCKMGSGASSNIHVVVVGSGYGGSAAARALDGKCKLTVIESADAFHHKIAALRGVVVPGWEKRIRIPLDKYLSKGKVIRGEVKSVETGRVTLSDETVIQCDYVILAHGQGKSNFPCDVTDDATDSAAYFEKMKNKQKVIASAQSILIIGGGPVGVELAGEIAAAHPGKKITIVHSGATILNNQANPMIEKARLKIEKRLAAMGVELKVNCRVNTMPLVQGGDAFVHDASMSRTTYVLSDGTSVSADLAIVCTGATRRQGNLVAMVDASNHVRVQPDLQVVGMPKVFCIGDANDVKETKMAYFAGKQGELAAKNIQLLESKKETQAYVPMDGQKEFGVMLVPLGPEKGVVGMGNMVMGDYMTSLLKGKGLFVKKNWGDFKAPVPPL